MPFSDALRLKSLTRLACVGIVALWMTGCAISTPTSAPASKGKAGAKAAAPATAQAAPAKPAEPEVAPASLAAYRQALAALKAERYPEAEKALLALAQREPTLSGPQANLGIVYARTGRWKQAIEAFKRATELNPDRAAYFDELGQALRQEGRFDDAQRAYERALSIDPNYAYAQLNLGILHDLYLQEPGKAVAYYERYKLLVPGDAGIVTKWIADAQQRTRAGSSTRTATIQEKTDEGDMGSTGATGTTGTERPAAGSGPR